jgi:hypothetical protein
MMNEVRRCTSHVPAATDMEEMYGLHGIIEKKKYVSLTANRRTLGTKLQNLVLIVTLLPVG